MVSGIYIKILILNRQEATPLVVRKEMLTAGYKTHEMAWSWSNPRCVVPLRKEIINSNEWNNEIQDHYNTNEFSAIAIGLNFSARPYKLNISKSPLRFG